MINYLKNIRYLLLFVFIVFGTSISCTSQKKDVDTHFNSQNIIHTKVFYEDGKFAGWPANNGIWNWGDEILVGFVVADHMERSGHTYDSSTSRYKYARSLDGGETWEIEDAYESGQTADAHDHRYIDVKSIPESLTEPINFTHPDLVFTLTRTGIHAAQSFFYHSYDRGKHFKGPFILPNLDTPGVAARTDYIVDDENEARVFLTIAKQNRREGRIAMFRTTDGGLSWTNHAMIGNEPEGFDIMPSSVRISSSEIITTTRGREVNPRRDFINAYISSDNGDTWDKLHEPVYDTGWGGSPPALLKLEDGRLALTYIFRSAYGSRVGLKFSKDNGQTWSHEITLRSDDYATNDVGYPRMVQRSDGKLVIIYYWNNAASKQNKPYRYIASTIVDPNNWE
jgi:Neuraminidase (sialidase)